MKRRFKLLTPLLAVGALLTAACEDAEVAGPELTSGESGVTLLLTDAPGDFVSAVVTIDEVFFVGSEGSVGLLDSPFTADLITLRNSFATMVQGVEVPEGTYSQVRLRVSGAYIEVEQEGGGTLIYASSPDYDGLPDGATVDGTLHMPSFGASGLKVKLPDGQLEVGEDEVIVLIDFDVEESFGHQAGRSGRWIMHPVVHATNVTFGGHVLAQLQLGEGITIPDLDGQPVTLAAFTAQVTPAGGGTARTVMFTDDDTDGVFEALFKGLPPGDYELTVLVPSGIVGTFDVTLPLTVTVMEKATTTELITLTSADLASTIVATVTLGTGVTLPMVGGIQVTLGDFTAALTPSGGSTAIEVAFTDDDSDGVFEATFEDLFPGEYSLNVLLPSGVTATLDPAPPVTVNVAAGATETTAFTVTSVP